MVISIAFTLGMREESVLTCLFMLTWTTMILGFTTELYSRPEASVDENVYTTKIGPGMGRTRENTDEPMTLQVISSDSWEGDRPAGGELVAAQRKLNFARRLFPFCLGWFPFLTVWILLVKFFVTSVEDVRQFRNDPEANLPDWVAVALLGTLVLYTSFAFVQPIFQYLPPGAYWGSEPIYLMLSLVSKVYLGLFLLLNVLLADEVVAREPPPPSTPLPSDFYW